MIFGQPTDFAIEAYHEPSGPEWGGYGRMSIHIQGTRLGRIRENHCSLFDAADRFRELCPVIETLWDESFTGLSDAEVFSVLDEALFIGKESGWWRYGRFDFLTNVGEQFNGFKTFIVCFPDGRVHILHRSQDDTFGSGSCLVQSFRNVAESFVLWFDEQVRATAAQYFPVEPFLDG